MIADAIPLKPLGDKHWESKVQLSRTVLAAPAQRRPAEWAPGQPLVWGVPAGTVRLQVAGSACGPQQPVLCSSP